MPTKNTRILIAPLDWGLGHATQCVPIIEELIAANVEVIIASDNRPAKFLKKIFPNLEHIIFPGYTIMYPVRSNMAWTMFRQLPKIFNGIVNERRFIKKVIKENKIDAVISNNRWGAYAHDVPSIFVAHQLRVLLSRYIKWGQGIVDLAISRLISPYTEVWIPDWGGDNNLSGELSHNTTVPGNSFYIGPLSHLKRKTASAVERDIIVILSGPEPQRTLFQTLIIDQLKKTSLKALIVQGMTESDVTIQITDHITMVSSLTSDQLSEEVARSTMIVSRPGYSTIMDLSSIGARAIFVPTPQQTEQEYLAQRLKTMGICYSESQEDFSLTLALEQSKNYSGFTMYQNDFSELKSRIRSLIESIEYKKQ